jgi:hypothetical protein
VTTIRPIPVDRYLVPDRATLALPPDAVRVQQAISRGLPTTFQLDAQLSIALYVPTGDAALWRDADPTALVAAAAEETGPRAPDDAEEPIARPAARFVLLRSGALLGAAVLRPGLACALPDDGSSPTLLQLWVLDYALHAGTLRDAGDFGSFVDFAWRRIDRGTDAFVQRALDPRVADRFAGQLQSKVGGRR